MVEYIEREAARQAHIKASLTTRLIDAIPAADVAPVRHGHWVFEPGKIPYCSECKKYSDDGDKGATFCPWCGARMDKEDEHEAD